MIYSFANLLSNHFFVLIMLKRFINRCDFESYEDFMRNFKIEVPENFNFGYDVVDAQAAANPDKVALLWTDEHGTEKRFTFADIKHYSDRAASYFSALGIGRGSRVMLMLKRRYQFWFAIIALHKLGATAIPATHLLTAKDIRYRCNKAGIVAIVAACEPSIVKNIGEALHGCPTVEHVVMTGKGIPSDWLDFDKRLERASDWVRPEHVNRNEDISLIYFTSGTSGEPKMVAHDFLYPLGHIITASFWHNLTPDSLHLTVADTGWGKAVWGKLYGQWIAGATVFVYDFEKFVAADLLRMIEKYRITSFCAPPTIFRFMIKENVKSYDLSSLRYCTIAGEALNPSVFEEWHRLTGLKLMEGFGQTETTLTIANFPWMEPKPGSMGKPGPEYDVRILEPDGKLLAPGEEGEGEIVVLLEGRHRPCGLTRGYLDDPEAMQRAFEGGLYHTGDIARVDEDGYLWFVGRTDDVIKSSGYRISPFEVESVLMSHPAVVECAVTGVPDEVRGQKIKASIVLARDFRDSNLQALAKDIQEHVKHLTAPYKYPRVIEFVEELPKTISGKVRHAAIRKAAMQANAVATKIKVS